MTAMTDPIDGTCLCGKVRVRGTPVSRHVDACHCTMCRKWTGGAFLGVECRGPVTIDSPEDVIRYASSPWAERGSCARCGSALFYYYAPDDHYTFAAGLFRDEDLLPLAEEIFIDEKPAYYAFADEGDYRRRLTGAQALQPGDPERRN